jgi:hypothetical protein
VGDVTLVDDIVNVEFQGDFDEQSDLLRTLVQSGHRVRTFAESEMDLEDVFMRVTTGKVQ